MERIKLTQFSPGAGCGCKIAPSVLEEIIGKSSVNIDFPSLLVGNDSKDDAAVFDLGDGTAIISTTDFFTPIVDDPFDFGRIAAVNAISDIYAMGGTPLMAIAILGWPLEKLPTEEAAKVIEGARSVCMLAGIPLAGGHSIDISDPVFGLAVTGKVDVNKIKKNNSATPGCALFLTKPLGVGIVTTAEKNGIVKPGHKEEVLKLMTTLNKVGSVFSELDGVKAMTDVTGFGLLGHLLEICEGSNLNAQIWFDKVPVISELQDYITKKSIPGGTFRNWKSYGSKIDLANPDQKFILCDPQTSGGLLVVVENDSVAALKALAKEYNTELFEIGVLKEKSGSSIFIEVK